MNVYKFAVRSLRCRVGSVLLCAAFAHAAFAEDISLSEALDRTLQQHPDLRVFALKRQQLQGAEQTAALRPALEMEFEVENFAGSGNFQAFDAAEATIALSSVIELGGQRRNRVAAVNARQKTLLQQQQVQALELMAQTTNRFVNLLAAQAHQQLATDAETLAQNALQAVQHRVNQGASPGVEALRAQAALKQTQLATSEARSKVEITRWYLVEMWAGDNIDFDNARGDVLQISAPQPTEQFIQRLQNNAHIQHLANEVATRQAQLDLAKANSAADVRWRVGVKQFQANDENALVAGVSVPLFGNRRNSGEVVSAAAELTQALLQQQSMQTQLRTHLLALLSANRHDFEKVTSLRDDVIPILQLAQHDAESAYQRGLYSYLDFAAVQQDLIHARKNLIDTAATALRLQAEIEQLTAEPLTLPKYSTNLPEANL